MPNNSFNFDRVIPLIDDVIRPSYLNKIQEIIIEQVWEGRTYSEIAHHHNYDTEYVKTKGCELWKLLSQSFGTQISKNTFVPFMRNHISLVERSLKFSAENTLDKALSESIPPPKIIAQERNYWTTAPDVKNFQGREGELTKLSSWSQDPFCRSIVVSGMVGCGKTSLATKFAKERSNQFEYVIWFSLTNFCSVKNILKNYLQIFTTEGKDSLLDDTDNIGNLLARFIEYLRIFRCLLIVDGLELILQGNHAATSYREGFEEYAQFLRCLVATEHQSLSIFTSSIKPKVLEYYASDRIGFLHLKGLEQSSINQVYRNRVTINLTELQWQNLSQYCQYNPQILNIFVGNLNNVSPEEFESSLREICLLREIEKLLERQLKYLSELEKEIVYWLAINSISHETELLERKITHFRPKSQLQESLNFLKERGFVEKKDNHYVLQALMKDYVQRKLIKIGLQH